MSTSSITRKVDPRDVKARQLAATMKLRRKGVLWLVPSQSKNSHYTVDATGDKSFCDCPDFETRHRPCKHILAVDPSWTMSSGRNR